MKAKKYIVFYFLLVSLSGFSQFKIWRLTAYSAQVGIGSSYREAVAKPIGHLISKQSGASANGSISVRTRSFFVHPNFMEVSLNGNYHPQTNREFYLAAPDYSEKSNTEGLDFSAIILKKKRLNITLNAGLNNSQINIEDLTRMKTKGKSFGAGLTYANKILPFSMSYSQDKAEQKTIGTSNIFVTENRNFQVNANRSFTSHDDNSFFYTKSNNKSLQMDNNLNPIRTSNNNNSLSYTNTLAFDKGRRYSLGSSISYSYRLGSMPYSTLGGTEGLNLKLPKKIYSTSSYNWVIGNQESNKVITQGFQSLLDHQLYESLSTRLSFMHNRMNQKDYNQQNNKFALNLAYLKKIPKGRLTLSYTFNKDYQRVKTPSKELSVFREEYRLIDGQFTLLKNQNVNIQSVVVRDSTGSRMYLLNVDYLLIDKNPYLEIIRVPGGNIANGSAINIDYTSLYAGLYKYQAHGNGFSATVNLFKNKLSVYYTVAWQGYNNKSKTENLVLDYYTSQVMGIRLDFNFIKGGVEYQNYKSNLLPSQGMRYFIIFQKTYTKLNFSLSGNVQDMKMTNEKERRQNFDASIAMAYSMFSNVNLHWNYQYRKMLGQGISIDAQNSKFAITGVFHQLSVSLGGQITWNKRLSGTNIYKGVYIHISRKIR